MPPYRLLVVPSIQQVDPVAWNLCAGSHLFNQHAFLKALETSEAVGVHQGVLPRYALLQDSTQQLIACAPAMLKWGTVREYGPEKLWLDKAQAIGCFSWPKFQLGVPFFPTNGPRLLIRPDIDTTLLRSSLLQTLKRLGPEVGAPDIFNIMHIDASTARVMQEAGALLSYEHQSIWVNANYHHLNHYLATLPQYKRTRFRSERRLAESQGLHFRVLKGGEITNKLTDQYYEGHRNVCARHGHLPWLPAATYREIVTAMPDSACFFGYFDRHSALVAGAFGLHAHDEGTLYLLQWSERFKHPGLALDLICLRPIDYAIHHRLQRVDSGLVARHKQLRNWQTHRIYNAHWFCNDRLKALATETLMNLAI